MATLTTAQIAGLVTPFYPDPAPLLLEQLSAYLDLLLKWNAQTNLTAIREPERIVTRHFGESLFAARHLPPAATTLLDLGSGAGFPGLPIQLVHPDLQVTLAESQNKKATFLREAVRQLNLHTTIWPHRTENLPVTRVFDVVTLRAVDNPTAALQEARAHLSPGGTILHLTTAHATNAIPIPDYRSACLQILK